MADKKEEATEGKPSGSKLKLIIIILLALILIGGGGGAAYYFLVMRAAPAEQAAEEGQAAAEGEGGEHAAAAAEEKEPPPGAEPIYHELDPITVNISGSGPVRFLKLNMTVVTRREAVIEAMTKHMPMIRNDLLSSLSGQDFAVINTPEGKDALREQLKGIISGILTRASEPSVIDDILFTEFVMQ